MKRTDIQRGLRGAAVPDASTARARTVTAARTEATRRSPRPPSTHPSRPHVFVCLCALGLTGTLLVTPAGQALTSWAGRLVGVGDVGGPPTREQRDQGAPVESSVILATGRAPDGARYEFVVDRFPTGMGPRAPSGQGVDGPDGETFKWCLGLEFPDVVPRGIGGFCGPELPPAQRDGIVRPFGGLNAYPGVTEHLVLSGFAEPEVSRVRVSYRDQDGEHREAPVDLSAADRELQRRTGSER